jgi:hypothetical protein
VAIPEIVRAVHRDTDEIFMNDHVRLTAHPAQSENAHAILAPLYGSNANPEVIAKLESVVITTIEIMAFEKPGNAWNTNNNTVPAANHITGSHVIFGA